MRSKSQLLREIDRVNALLEDDARKLGLGTKKSLATLSQLRNDNKLFSERAKLEFREYVRRQLLRTPTPGKRMLEVGGARLLGLSPATTKRYMEELRAERGPFAGLGEQIILNPNYVKPEEDPYWIEWDDEEGSV